MMSIRPDSKGMLSNSDFFSAIFSRKSDNAFLSVEFISCRYIVCWIIQPSL